MHPVLYFSKRTTDSESRYHSYELGMMAIVYALERFRVYLQGMSFTIVTDCNAIKMALSKKDINPRISRWVLLLQNYDYKVEHRPGERMQHVDALSRNMLVIEPLSFDQILVYKQLQDSVIRSLRHNLESSENKNFELRNGVVYRKHRNIVLFYVPELMVRNVIQTFHDDVGHVGLEKTMDLLTKVYWFPRMRAIVKNHISNCIKCITYSVPSGKSESRLHLYEKGTKPFYTLHADHFGPLEKAPHGFKHILLIIDAFTKFTMFYPTKSTTSKEAISRLIDYFKHFGTCKQLVTDRGTCFTSGEFSDFLHDYGVEHVKVASATPRGNGQVERVNRFLRSVLEKESSNEQWTKSLEKVQFSINNTYHKAIATTPSLMLFVCDQKRYTDDELREHLINCDHDANLVTDPFRAERNCDFSDKAVASVQ